MTTYPDSHPGNHLTPLCWRVLDAILCLTRNRCTTVREIILKLGYDSPNIITLPLAKLRKAGLIASEPRKARTIRPLVRYIPAEKL